MPEERKPAYWTVLPARVRYDKELRPNAKLLYAEICALADATGYCWAPNEYFAKLYNLTIKTISELISSLARRGHIFVEIIRDEKNEVKERRIWVDKPVSLDDIPLPKNPDTPLPKNRETPPPKNQESPLPKNREENNTNNINNIPPIVPQGGRQRREPKKAPDWKPERFEKFWRYYPRGEAKQAAIRAWDKLKPSDELIDQMAIALKRQMASEEWQRGIGIPYASTWLNQRRFEDEIKAPPKQIVSDGCGSWAEDEEVI